MRLVPSDAWVCVSELSSVVLELKTAFGRLVGQEYFLSAESVPRCRIWAHNILRSRMGKVLRLIPKALIVKRNPSILVQLLIKSLGTYYHSNDSGVGNEPPKHSTTVDLDGANIVDTVQANNDIDIRKTTLVDAAVEQVDESLNKRRICLHTATNRLLVMIWMMQLMSILPGL